MEWRALLAIALSIIVLLVFQIFFGNQQSNAPAPKGAANVTTDQGKRVQRSLGPQKKQEVSKVAASSRERAGTKTGTKKEILPPLPGETPKDIIVETDLYKAVFSERGGAIKAFYLKRYRQSVKKDSPPVNIVKAVPPVLPLTIKTRGAGSTSPIFLKASTTRLDLNSPGTGNTLTFTGMLPGEIPVQMVYKFKKGSYWIDLRIQVAGSRGVESVSIALSNSRIVDSSRAFQGVSYLTPEGMNDVKMKPGEEKSYLGPLTWLSIGDKYFIAALVPLTQGIEEWKVTMTRINDQGLEDVWLTPGETKRPSNELRLGLYFGPKEIDSLKAVDHELAEAINFGWFDIVARPLLYFLKFLYRFTHNYGVAIIVLTVLIKIAFWPLAHKGAKAMKTMQKIQPRLQKLKEKYGDDKERLNKELLQIYKTYKVNPMSGCLPMLLQIPVFFALYKVLLQAIELRHAPFMLWINDLSAPDRLMIPGVDIPMVHGLPVLTILMGISMWGQQKLSPASLDPTQAQMMQFLPLVFTFMFITFPSGLVLYWLVNNVLSIVQQYYINEYTD